jgi:trimethylamine-N-oxide reductase (cytochrome c)
VVARLPLEETKFGDVILPATTNFERSDISEWTSPGGYGHGNAGTNHRVMIYQHKCIEPLWEARGDWEIYKGLADRLGFLDEYAEGNSEEDWMKKIFYYSDIKYLTRSSKEAVISWYRYR